MFNFHFKSGNLFKSRPIRQKNRFIVDIKHCRSGFTEPTVLKTITRFFTEFIQLTIEEETMDKDPIHRRQLRRLKNGNLVRNTICVRRPEKIESDLKEKAEEHALIYPFADIIRRKRFLVDELLFKLWVLVELYRFKNLSVQAVAAEKLRNSIKKAKTKYTKSCHCYTFTISEIESWQKRFEEIKSPVN